jgi:DNA-binding NarL/FixJ family response regulator
MYGRAEESITPLPSDAAGKPAAERICLHHRETIPDAIRRTVKLRLRRGIGETEDYTRRSRRDKSPAQQRILTLLRQGVTYREIADHLHTTEKTIRRYIRRLAPEAPRSCPPF